MKIFDLDTNYCLITFYLIRITDFILVMKFTKPKNKF